MLFSQKLWSQKFCINLYQLMNNNISLKYYINFCCNVQQYTDKDSIRFNLDLIFLYNAKFLYDL